MECAIKEVRRWKINDGDDDDEDDDDVDNNELR